MNYRKVRLTAGILGAAAALALAGAPSSLAATSSTTATASPDDVYLNLGHFNASNVNIRSTPSTSSPAIYGEGQVGQAFCFNNFIYNNNWLWGYRGSTHPGYVWQAYITYNYTTCEIV